MQFYYICALFGTNLQTQKKSMQKYKSNKKKSTTDIAEQISDKN